MSRSDEIRRAREEAELAEAEARAAKARAEARRAQYEELKGYAGDVKKLFTSTGGDVRTRAPQALKEEAALGEELQY